MAAATTEAVTTAAVITEGATEAATTTPTSLGLPTRDVTKPLRATYDFFVGPTSREFQTSQKIAVRTFAQVQLAHHSNTSVLSMVKTAAAPTTIAGVTHRTIQLSAQARSPETPPTPPADRTASLSG